MLKVYSIIQIRWQFHPIEVFLFIDGQSEKVIVVWHEIHHDIFFAPEEVIQE